jgi:hypothetical protein
MRLADRKKQAREFSGFRANTLLDLLPAQYPGCADFIQSALIRAESEANQARKAINVRQILPK